MSNTPSKSFSAYITAWEKLEHLKCEINKSAAKRGDFNVTLTALFIKVIENTQIISQVEFNNFVLTKQSKFKEHLSQKTFIVPQRITDYIKILASDLEGRNARLYNVVSFAIENSKVTGENYFNKNSITIGEVRKLNQRAMDRPRNNTAASLSFKSKIRLLRNSLFKDT